MNGPRLCSLPLLLMLLAASACTPARPLGPRHDQPFTLDHGGIIRGDTSRKRLALIFTGGEYGEGTEHILNVLQRQGVQASFFVTGDYLRRPEYQPHLRRMLAEGHYLGPHSDSHPLYCAWENRQQTLVTESFFRQDIERNLRDLRKLGAPPPSRVVYFIPPYEWFNEDQVRWAGRMGLRLFNYSPGSGSNRDWAPEGHRSFVPARVIVDDILAREQSDPHGLNGFLLLLHLGAQRQDKVFPLLEPLIVELKARGYSFTRVDELLDDSPLPAPPHQP
jgi:peptidoglycan/xylan/chitin deacetylase (PgdA/CDA1 family)